MLPEWYLNEVLHDTVKIDFGSTFKETAQNLLQNFQRLLGKKQDGKKLVRVLRSFARKIAPQLVKEEEESAWKRLVKRFMEATSILNSVLANADRQLTAITKQFIQKVKDKRIKTILAKLSDKSFLLTAETEQIKKLLASLKKLDPALGKKVEGVVKAVLDLRERTKKSVGESVFDKVKNFVKRYFKKGHPLAAAIVFVIGVGILYMVFKLAGVPFNPFKLSAYEMVWNKAPTVGKLLLIAGFVFMVLGLWSAGVYVYRKLFKK